MSTVTVQVRMDSVLKQSAESIFNPAVPTRTLDAIQEAKDIAAHPEKYKGYTDWDELMEELNA